MEKHLVKNQRDSKIELTVNWQHIEEVLPAFKRLMVILLKPREDGLVKRNVSNNFQRKRETETDTER